MKSVTIGARISPELDATLERLALLTGRPKSWHLCEALEAYAANEQQFISAVKEGLADARAGRVVDHEAVVGYFKKRFKKTPKR